MEDIASACAHLFHFIGCNDIKANSHRQRGIMMIQLLVGVQVRVVDQTVMVRSIRRPCMLSTSLIAVNCRHCGTSEKSTPMMRRGPEGPRTLCNACGLMWANKGTLRDLSKSAPQVGQSTSALNRNPEVSETLLKRGKLGRSRPAKGVLEIPVRQ
ncbi:unnamed protein product [Linum tenue]|uniref:GATA-type domain-containing protein n=1 Tax=Linum tenue TaxID=586396 RepID=A0AAV0JJG9_9ROSI|nr:unnamed protein product [Linum tenue]